MNQKTRSVMTICGSIIAFIGFYLPWYSVAFDPPRGYLIFQGQRINALNDTVSGWNYADPNGWNYTENLHIGALFHATIVAMLLIGLLDFIKLLLPEKTANKAIYYIAKFFHAKFTGSLIDIIHAFVSIVLSLFLIGLLFVVFHFGSASLPYLAFILGVGCYVMFAGILIGGIAVYKKIPIIAGIILVVMVFLYCSDSPYLAQFLNYVGTYK